MVVRNRNDGSYAMILTVVVMFDSILSLFKLSVV